MLLLVESRLGLLVFVGPVEDGAKEPSIDGTCVHDDGVLLVVASVRQDRHYSIDTWARRAERHTHNDIMMTSFVMLLIKCFCTSRQFSESEVLHGPGGDQRFLGVPEDVGQSVHPHMEVGDVDSHCLFPHS